jgi:hypothetical protein
MAVPRPHPSLRERVKLAMRHPLVRSVTATTTMQGVLRCVGSAAVAFAARPPGGIPHYKGDNDGTMASIWTQACARH